MELNNFLLLLAQALLIVALPILIVAGVYWLRQKALEIKGKMNKDQLAMIESLGSLAVRAAEQAGLAKQIAGGAAKKEYAIKVAQDYLNGLGVKVDVRAIANVIESEVIKQFNNSAPLVDSPQTRAALLDKAIECAVLAAEQSGLKAVGTSAAMNLGVSVAQQKKQYALDLANKYLEEHGVKMDMQLIDGMLEAQIMRFKIQAAEAAARN